MYSRSADGINCLSSKIAAAILNVIESEKKLRKEQKRKSTVPCDGHLINFITNYTIVMTFFPLFINYHH